MTAYKFFLTVISLLAYISLCRGQRCFPKGKTSQIACFEAWANINTTDDNTILAGETKVYSSSKSCLVEVISKNTGPTQRSDMYDAMVEVENKCSPAMVGTLSYPHFDISLTQVLPNTPIFGRNIKLDQPSCNIKSPFSSGKISPPDCSKAIDTIQINSKSPQKILSQSKGEIRASFKTCFVFIKSSNQLDITMNHDQLKKMSSLITGKCKEQTGSVVKQFGSFGLNSRTEMQIYFHGKPV
ncbi:hypothetical protein PGT21_021145 [Puccinia graminis f. sp. tritici]|uniref:Uncharacterized protein n=2 Tax=Puccinia graminis f. sp. tritici TaxID=56615 RepID=E3KDQ0_PUCGT|nr:uncharacterized protein PGTG_08442 [Puccinia graminis f. sp. tritici CRL 75-36-700-3]EFP82486.2 hypothetical protein PGTG_08442 [Puccinia graminis f. sp. tritici CRL 75-36-700-3]KAA1079711.1 hypothetical protein PGT21_022105 [Puccinia graminis f. sp. tritici]KAA1082945.1 hypothetical protein PGT21_021145 [Puccinia graminis f. sp. tritici]KAA1124122.1 hypothetical protein PGTUg99_028562 [Puccinia graminis f. sp. tritici]